MTGHVKMVSISNAKGTKKVNVPEVTLKQDYGIVGDAHAGTAKRQVSILAMESIDKMAAKGAGVGPGDFAENVTVEDIDMSKLILGSKIRAGETVILEISQIGKVCHGKCDIYNRIGDCVMPKEGIFARVLIGGTIKPGDKVEVM